MLGDDDEGEEDDEFGSDVGGGVEEMAESDDESASVSSRNSAYDTARNRHFYVWRSKGDGKSNNLSGRTTTNKHNHTEWFLCKLVHLMVVVAVRGFYYL